MGQEEDRELIEEEVGVSLLSKQEKGEIDNFRNITS